MELAGPCGWQVLWEPVHPAGQEGLHIFDVSDPTNPVGKAFVRTPCGSHTATGVPDLANNRLLVYNNPSSGAVGCRGIDIVEVPLDDPAAATCLRLEPSGDPRPAQPNLVTIEAPSSAAGTYLASGAAFGPAPDLAGIAGDVVLVNDGSALPTEGCNPLVGFPAGAVALVDRGTCSFVQKVSNAQAAGAIAVIVVNNVAGPPTTMGGTDPTITIPSVMVSLADGGVIKAGLPATGRVSAAPLPENPDRACHDTGVILGDALKVSCAGSDGFTVWSLDPADGGSLEDPAIQYSKIIPGVSIGHSAGFTWDGEVLIFGHEPGGGGQAECQASSSVVNRTLFFYDADTGAAVGPSSTTATDEPRELHVAQLQRGAHRQAVRPGRRQLPIRHQCGRLHRPGPRLRDRLRRPRPAGQPGQPRSDRARRRLVHVLVRRPHLRVRHHARPHHLEPQRQGSGRRDETRPPQPADAGNVVPFTGTALGN